MVVLRTVTSISRGEPGGAITRQHQWHQPSGQLNAAGTHYTKLESLGDKISFY